MRWTMLSLVAGLGLALGCSSTTDLEMERDLRLLDYSLSEVEGVPLSGPASSLPGLILWEGTDGSKLTVARGGLSCSADGTAEETYLFRLSQQGSDVWDPIWVDVPLTCEMTGPASVTFRNTDTGEVIAGSLMERLDGCPVIVKNLPSPVSLEAGYLSATSGAGFPAGLDLTGSRRGQFMASECLEG